VQPEVAWRFVVEHGGEIEVLTFEPRAPQAPGVLNDISGRMMGMRFRAVSRTVVWDPPSRCVFESVKPSWPVTTRITEEFRSRGGSTEHIIDYEIHGRATIGSVVAPILCRMMKRNRRKYQERLRHALERGSEE
jgi:hypothetical protein